MELYNYSKGEARFAFADFVCCFGLWCLKKLLKNGRRLLKQLLEVIVVVLIHHFSHCDLHDALSLQRKSGLLFISKSRLRICQLPLQVLGAQFLSLLPEKWVLFFSSSANAGILTDLAYILKTLLILIMNRAACEETLRTHLGKVCNTKCVCVYVGVS